MQMHREINSPAFHTHALKNSHASKKKFKKHKNIQIYTKLNDYFKIFVWKNQKIMWNFGEIYHVVYPGYPGIFIIIIRNNQIIIKDKILKNLKKITNIIDISKYKYLKISSKKFRISNILKKIDLFSFYI
jgi:hypothetical protein